MDSMKSLNRSLPKSNQPSEQLLQAFKTAAVSVTNLYREAVSGQTGSRAAGYQDALDDLLTFLDKQNLGLDDGEGWLVRQWATGRLEDRPPCQTGNQEQQAASESEEEKEQEKEKSPSPVQPESSPIHPTSTHRAEPQKEEQTAPQQQQTSSQKPVTTAPSSGTFNFESTHAYPRDIDMQSHDTNNQLTTRSEASPRATRHQHKRNGAKQGHRAVSARILGAGGGSKRKFNYGEFFDISGIGENKEGSRTSAKRGRTG